jgi:serine/threonine protein kinase
VNLVRDHSSNDSTPLVIKSISIPQLKYQQEIDHVYNEKKVMQRILDEKIENCATLVTTFKADDCVNFVQEFVEGKLLTEYIKSEMKCFNHKTVKHIFMQVLKIIKNLHSHGILYRDLKLTNLIINEDERVTLIDFGLSKILEPGQRTFSICGTAHAMSPELVKPPKEGYGFEVDCFALGVFLYELFELDAPFGYKRDRDDFEFRRIKESKLKDLISRLLEFEVTDRFSIDDIYNHPWILSEAADHGDGEERSDQAAVAAGDDAKFWDDF